jgi:hypothetical protein
MKHLSPDLIKAVIDPFDYACKLRTGEVIVFREARQATKADMQEGYDTENYDEVSLEEKIKDPGWIKLENIDVERSSGLPPSVGFDRGMWVRVNDIVWTVDAPAGS